MTSEPTTINKLEQGRSATAYEYVKNTGSKNKEYKALVKKIPMYIKTNGLGNTFAFIQSKAEKNEHYKLAYEQTTAWLKTEQNKLISQKLNEYENLVEALINIDSLQYRMVTVEVLAFFNWLRRFAEGLIEGEAD